MNRYAEHTAVSADASRAEIERILKRFGADQFMYGWKDEAAVVGFRAKGRHVRFLLPLPKADEYALTPARGSSRSAAAIERAHAQAIRQRWRALALSIKAKLEAVDSGITHFEQEFYAHIVLPGGRTVYEQSASHVALAYDRGTVGPLLPHLEP